MPHCVPLIPPEELPEKAAELLATWFRLNAESGGPTRRDFTPFSLKSWLGNIDIYHVENAGENGEPDFRLRLNGSATVALTDEDWTGSTAREIDCVLGARLQDDLLQVFRTRLPRAEVIQLFRKNYMTAHRLLLPVFSETGGGEVAQVFLAIFSPAQA